MSIDRVFIDQAWTLVDAGKYDQAVAVLGPQALRPAASLGLVCAYAVVLKVADRLDEALAQNRRAVQQWPESGVVWYGLAATLSDMHRYEEAIEASDKALSHGLDEGETWLIHARAHTAAGDPDRAQAAYRKVLEKDPTDSHAAIELAQLAWRRTGDASLASAHLGAAIDSAHDRLPLIATWAAILEHDGRTADSAAMVIDAARKDPDDAELAMMAARACLKIADADQAMDFAHRGATLAPDHPDAAITVAMASLATGRPAPALAAARLATRLAPGDQGAWAWLATTARAAGDPAYEALYDYDAFVRAFHIETPPGWPSLESFLKDLAEALDRRHKDAAHPLDQSLRNGTQTFSDLSRDDDPAIVAFHRAIDEPIRRYMAEIGPGDDPLRRRNTGDYRLTGSWSVRLRAEGSHVDHFHSDGWLSSAFYVRVPASVTQGADHAGSIRFGRSPHPSRPELPAAHWVKPEPGLLVLFPSYMWHGTEPFAGEETRLTIAFDVVPA